MSAQPNPRLTPEQYLAIDREAELRSEYYDGEMFEISAATYAHALTSTNLTILLGVALKPHGCTVVSSSLRVRASAGRSYCYPDLAVICGEPRFADDQKDTVVNPVLIIEVLSKSTEANDRGFKFAQYRQIESVQEYVLVSVVEPRIEIFRRGPTDGWIFHDVSVPGAVCEFTSVGVKFALADVYKNVPLFEASA